MLVDDSADVALIVQRLGGRAGCEVSVCGDTTSAWTVLQQQRPTLLLLDLNLPGEAGDVLCRRVRATPALADLKIAWLSSWACSEDILRGLAAGVDYLFSKELLCEPKDWMARLSEILSGTNAFAEELRAKFRGRLLLPRPSVEAFESLNHLFRQPLLRRLGPDGIRELLRRIPEQFGGDRSCWFRTDGLNLDSAVQTENVATFVLALAEMFGRLLGARDCAPLRDSFCATADLLCDRCCL